MIQNFQCPACGSVDVVGEPYCKTCGEAFIYNCPVCGASIDYRYTTCPNCQVELNWGTRPPQILVTANPRAEKTQTYTGEKRSSKDQTEVKQTDAKSKGRRKYLLWLALIFICIFMIITIFVIDRVVNK